MNTFAQAVASEAQPDTGDVAADTALAAFVMMLNFLGRAADPAQLRHALGKGSERIDSADLLRLAKRLDVKAKRVVTPLGKIAQHPLPAIARMKDDTRVVLLQANEKQALVFAPGAERPVTVALDDFAREFSGELVLMATRERVAGGDRKFDVTWFIPALVKYRHLLRDVLVASFFLQLLGLVNPLFFQVVVDKVLVHKGFTTLEVLAVGFFVVVVFEVIMGALRTYLFAHTTSRVDAELGAKLFGHLTHLPLAYFQTRRVGDSLAQTPAARKRGASKPRSDFGSPKG